MKNRSNERAMAKQRRVINAFKIITLLCVYGSRKSHEDQVFGSHNNISHIPVPT